MANAGYTNAGGGHGKQIRLSIMLSAVLTLLFLATGCRYTAAPADLLQKPAIAPDKQAIVQAIEKSLPSYSKLTLPVREEHMGAIRLIDVDGDGTNEAIVSYYNEYSTPELMVFKYTASAWKPWLLIQQPLARQIEWLKFEDLDKDGQKELIIGWIGGFDSPNVLEIYSFQSKPIRNESGKLTIQPIESLPYTYAESGDLDNDGRSELVVISETGTNQEIALPEYQLTIYKWTNRKLKEVYGESINNGVNAYDRILIGRISEQHRGIILEASTGAHSSYTAMYVWEKGKLRLVYPNESEGIEGIVGKPTYSQDINGDGILELQWSREAPGYPDVAYAYSKWVNDWMQWDGHDGFKKITEEFTDYRYGIQMRIPNQWLGRYTLHNADNELYAVVAIDYWNEETKATAKLATLYAVPQKQWGSVEAGWRSESKSFRQVFTDSGNVFVTSFVKEAPADGSDADRKAFREMLEAEAEFTSSLTIRND
ncbi:hypothetical protein FHS15_003123 [Paenibacillus castaneae]|uniref:FG-GAP repeat domain-containing protein n=1 Tax=Paenibacillus castaneae TaxID=474957 RepID=UPI000C9D03A3|nr:VCBS repeat-containing protein [Paenibacillus castaneae]NIK77985.1 hypothetical protein [Paenibacillus castaneae]